MSNQISEPKFRPGDTVWFVVKSGTTRVPCDFCAARGWFRLRDGRKVQCGECYGEGARSAYEKHRWQPRSLSIGQASFTLDESEVRRGWSYTGDSYSDSSSDWHEEHELFATKADALAEAERLGAQDLESERLALYSRHPNEPTEEEEEPDLEPMDPSETTTVEVVLFIGSIIPDTEARGIVNRVLLRSPEYLPYFEVKGVYNSMDYGS